MFIQTQNHTQIDSTFKVEDDIVVPGGLKALATTFSSTLRDASSNSFVERGVEALEFAFAAAEQAALAKPTLWDLRSLVLETQARGEGNADDVHKRYLARTLGNERRQFPTGALWIVRLLEPIHIIINVLGWCVVGCPAAGLHATHWKQHVLLFCRT
jgi:hypothetical protein